MGREDIIFLLEEDKCIGKAKEGITFITRHMKASLRIDKSCKIDRENVIHYTNQKSFFSSILFDIVKFRSP